MSRSGIMLCYPFEEKRLLKWNPPYIVQPKLDGERCRYVNKDEYSFLFSSEENPIWGVPHIKSFLDSFKLPFELDGELYCHGMCFDDIHSIVSREVNIHSDYQNMEYHVFDVVDETLPQYQRMQVLKTIESTLGSGPVKFVESYIANSFEDVMRCYDQILIKGYEGIVVREINNQYRRVRSTSMMKFKPKKSDDYEIVGYCEEVDKYGQIKEGILGKLICGSDPGMPILGHYPAQTKLPTGYFGVGTGFTDSNRQYLFSVAETLLRKKVSVSYQHLTHGNGVPRFPVFAKVID